MSLEQEKKERVENTEAKCNDIKFSYGITTNGTIISNEITNFLKKNNFTLLVSFDGINNFRR
jgi:sulfatase maturation enzyme AslB (radical SAM superfamily)